MKQGDVSVFMDLDDIAPLAQRGVGWSGVESGVRCRDEGPQQNGYLSTSRMAAFITASLPGGVHAQSFRLPSFS